MTNLPCITKKQESIISLIFRFRFLNRIQIQKFLKHKDYKTINEWLKDLVEKEYLSRSYKTSFPDKLNPAVYHLAKNGIAYFKNQSESSAKLVQKFYRENERTKGFIDSCQLIADIYLDLQNRATDKISFEMFVKSDYSGYELEFLLNDLKPNAYIEQTTSSKTKQYFLETFADYPLTRIRMRVKKYLSFYQSNEWEGTTKKSFPTVLVICPDDMILAYAKRYAKTRLAQLDEPDLTLHLTTLEKVKELGITGDIWKKA